MFRNYQCSNFKNSILTAESAEATFSRAEPSREPSSTFGGGPCLTRANLLIRRPHLRWRGCNFETVAQHILWPMNAEPPLTPTLIAERSCQICE